jgi:hypothetical protein
LYIFALAKNKNMEKEQEKVGYFYVDTIEGTYDDEQFGSEDFGVFYTGSSQKIESHKKYFH